jgi:uncharacterized membrane protein
MTWGRGWEAPLTGPSPTHSQGGSVEAVITILGQLALALSGGVLIVALVWVILSIFAAIVRRVQDLSR